MVGVWTTLADRKDSATTAMRPSWPNASRQSFSWPFWAASEDMNTLLSKKLVAGTCGHAVSTACV